ncbi:excinuclease ABC subunit A, partial [bacterium]
MPHKTTLRAISIFEVNEPEDKTGLIIEGLRQNNLKNLSIRIPHDKITVIAGLSGSGKSSLAFDTLFAEGRWRFIESLSTYSRLFLERMDRPELDLIKNIRPAIAVEQKNTIRTSRSTVGTATELNDYLRLFFARAGKVHCPECGLPAKQISPSDAAKRLLSTHNGKPGLIGFKLQNNITDYKDINLTADELIKNGWIRIKIGDKVVNLSTQTLPANTRPNEIGVITDRIVIKEDDLSRLTAALEEAYKHGNGTAWAEITGKDNKPLIERFSNGASCLECNVNLPQPAPLSLSFNHPTGACPECRGFGNVLNYDIDRIVPDANLSLSNGAIEPWTKPAYTWWYGELKKHAHKNRIDLDKPFNKLSQREKKLVMDGTAGFDGINGFFAYLDTKKYKLHIKVFTSRYKGQTICSECNGARLNKAALRVKVAGLSIADVNAMTIKKAAEFFGGLQLTSHEKEVSKELLRQIDAKLVFLSETGLGYITLDRMTKTLSGGEAQRMHLATQLASSLTGVLYILDEPSIGLHPVDADVLAEQLKKLSSRGNTVVVVEHDTSIIRASDHIIELGPGAGERGGRVVYSGSTADFLKNGKTLTANYLTGKEVIHTPRWRRKGSGTFLTLRGARGNNLKNIDVKIPLKTLTCVTGVSGSGKSSLVADTLYNILAGRANAKDRAKSARLEKPLSYDSFEGAGNITGVKLIDQGPMGRTHRSNPITYTGGYDDIRRVFGGLPLARTAGFKPGHFSFNVKGGRCESCKGDGAKTLDMFFLPDLYVKCEACNGKRFKRQVLNIKYRGKNIFDCLNMTFDDAAMLFSRESRLVEICGVIKDVGLGYLRLGQSALTLSGGEAQRLKITRELLDKNTSGMLYIFDEPTTGLHMDDIKRLLTVIGRLVDSGSTVIVIEHNLDFIKTADHVIDLGPGGG